MQGFRAGFRTLLWCWGGGVLDLYQQPLSWARRGWDEWGGWTGSTAGLLGGVIFGALSFALKVLVGLVDFAVKTIEGIKAFFSPRVTSTARQEYPLVVDTDG